MPGLTPLEIALVGGNALGSMFSGMSQASAQKADTKERARQFNMSQAPGMARLRQSAPLRDRLLQILERRFGGQPSTYTQAQGMYAPSKELGAQQDLYTKLLGQMGYGPGGAGGIWSKMSQWRGY